MRDGAAAARFADRFATWRQLFLNAGAARAYPYAWRLPELARPLGGTPVAHAQLALAHTLYCLGRFAEARAAIPDDASADDTAALITAPALRARCALILTDDDIAGDLSAYLAFLTDQPANAGVEALVTDEPNRLFDEVLAHWRQARRAQQLDVAAAQVALARLRQLAPAMAAHAEAILTEAAFHVGPAWSLVWLDAALEQCARYAQHHLEARLLHFKSRALEASGQLRDAQRFLEVARQLAERQGARRYLRGMVMPLAVPKSVATATDC